MSKEVNDERAPRTVTDVKEMLTKHSNGEIQRTIQNCITILQNDHVLADAIRLNLLSERIDIVKPVGWPRSGKPLNDTDMKYILRRMEKYGISSEKKIESAIRIVANENRYHPIRDYLNSLKWDGTERIPHVLHHFLGAAEDEYTCEAMKIFLLGAFKPGCKFEVMLCLVGGQGAGKSSFFRLLAVNDDWFSDDLKKLDDENVYRKMQGHWIIEMSEMIATANAKSIEEIKSFLSRQKETYKIPYETHPADRKRQCVFGGSSNTLDFLPLDRTGNRRFVPVMVYPERAEVHILADEQASREYINQMWAEAMEIYRSGNFRLDLSFILWWLLMACTAGIAGIYVLPYYKTTRALYYQNFRMRALATGQLTEDDFLSEAERMAKYGAYGAYTAPRREQQPMNGQYNPYTPPMADDFRSYEQCGYGGTQQGTNQPEQPQAPGAPTADGQQPTQQPPVWNQTPPAEPPVWNQTPPAEPTDGADE